VPPGHPQLRPDVVELDIHCGAAVALTVAQVHSGHAHHHLVGCNTSGVKHALSIANHDHEHHLAFIITCNISVTLD
jgi:hypothetical protein